MSAFDELKNKAADLAEQAKEGFEKVSDVVIDKAGDAADAVTGGKFSDQIDSFQEKADSFLAGSGDEEGGEA